MIDNLDLNTLRKIPHIGYYFRYNLHRHDFRELTYKSELRGHYTAKPLYGKMTLEGRVDTSSSFNGDVATLFVPLSAREAKDAHLFITHTDPAALAFENGKKNWKVINGVAERYIKRKMAKA